MRYVCIADVHGCYDKMIKALNDAHFNPATDTLISLGDLFDRGDQSREVLQYVMSCPNHILCMGNHDLRLMQIIAEPYKTASYDFSNGIQHTLDSFDPIEIGEEDIARKTYCQLYDLKSYNLLREYFRQCVAAIEFPDLICTHGWLPTIREGNKYALLENWREARGDIWDAAFWGHTEIIVSNKAFPEKTLLIGHWHAWRLAEKFGEKRQENKRDENTYINCDTFVYRDKFIALDGCSNWPYGGKVNTYVFESDAEPILYRGGLGKWWY